MDHGKAKIGSMLGASIRAWRRRNKLTISQLAEKADIDAGFLAYIETGKKLPSLHTTHKLSDALGLRLSELFHGTQIDRRLGFRAELNRMAQSICLKCSRAQHDDLLTVFRYLDDPRKVRAIRILLDG